MILIDNFNLDQITPLSQASIQKSEDNNEKNCETKSNMCIGKPNTEEIKKQIMFIKDALYIKNNINMSKEHTVGGGGQALGGGHLDRQDCGVDRDPADHGWSVFYAFQMLRFGSYW